MVAACKGKGGEGENVPGPGPEGQYDWSYHEEDFVPEDSHVDVLRGRANLLNAYGVQPTASDMIAKDFLDGNISERDYFLQQVALNFGVGDLDQRYKALVAADPEIGNFCGTPFAQEMNGYLARPDGTPEIKEFLKGFARPTVESDAAPSGTTASASRSLASNIRSASSGSLCGALNSETRIPLSPVPFIMGHFLTADRCILARTPQVDVEIFYKEGDNTEGYARLVADTIERTSMWQAMRDFFGDGSLNPRPCFDPWLGASLNATPNYNVWIAKDDGNPGNTIGCGGNRSYMVLNAGAYGEACIDPSSSRCYVTRYPRGGFAYSAEQFVGGTVIHEFAHAFEHDYFDTMFLESNHDYSEGLAQFAIEYIDRNSNMELLFEDNLFHNPQVPITEWKENNGYPLSLWFRYLYYANGESIEPVHLFLQGVREGRDPVDLLFIQNNEHLHGFALANMNLEHSIPGILKYRQLDAEYPKAAIVSPFRTHLVSGEFMPLHGAATTATVNLSPFSSTYAIFETVHGRFPNHYLAIENNSDPNIRAGLFLISVGNDRGSYEVIDYHSLGPGKQTFDIASERLDEQPGIVAVVAAASGPREAIGNPDVKYPMRIELYKRSYKDPVNFNCDIVQEFSALPVPAGAEIIQPFRSTVRVTGRLRLSDEMLASELRGLFDMPGAPNIPNIPNIPNMQDFQNLQDLPYMMGASYQLSHRDYEFDSGEYTASAQGGYREVREYTITDDDGNIVPCTETKVTVLSGSYITNLSRENANASLAVSPVGKEYHFLASTELVDPPAAFKFTTTVSDTCFGPGAYFVDHYPPDATCGSLDESYEGQGLIWEGPRNPPDIAPGFEEFAPETHYRVSFTEPASDFDVNPQNSAPFLLRYPSAFGVQFLKPPVVDPGCARLSPPCQAPR